MRKLVWCVTPVNGYDLPGLERWLERQTAKGLMFDMTAGPLTLFRRSEPARLQFHLEPSPDKPDRIDPELNALYAQAGWRYLGLFRSSFAVFVTENLEAQAHTDPEIWDYALKRFFWRKLLAGLGLLVLNFFFLSLYWGRVSLSLSDLRWFPMEVFSRQPLAAAVLSVLGVVLVDLSWLTGLFALEQYRRDITLEKPPAKRSHGGGLLMSGILILVLVLADAFWPITGLNHPIDPASDFVSLADIEGDIPDFQVGEQTRNFYYYGYYSGSLFQPECWSFHQTGRHQLVNGATDQSVPHLNLWVYRYPLSILAGWMAEEQSRMQWNGGAYEVISPLQEGDQVFLSQDRFDPEWDVYPTTRLILRRGNDVLLAEYHGAQNLTQFLPRFAQMLENL